MSAAIADDRRRRRAARCPGQQRRLRLLRRARGCAAGGRAPAVRGQRVRAGAPDPARVADHARARSAGKIVNITSIGGKMHEPFGAWYHATKFAVEGMSDCLRMEARAVRHRRDRDRARRHQDRMERRSRATICLKYSGGGAYAEGAQSPRADVRQPPIRAARLRRPKSWRRPSRARWPRRVRARATRPARAPKPILFLRWLLSDRAFDWLMGFIERGKSQA